MMNVFQTLLVVLVSLLGGIVRYLTEFIIEKEHLRHLSFGMLLIHSIIGVFSGLMAYFIVVFLWPTAIFEACLLAAGLGSFGSYGFLIWALKVASRKMPGGSGDVTGGLEDRMKKKSNDRITKKDS